MCMYTYIYTLCLNCAFCRSCFFQKFLPIYQTDGEIIIQLYEDAQLYEKLIESEQMKSMLVTQLTYASGVNSIANTQTFVLCLFNFHSPINYRTSQLC